MLCEPDPKLYHFVAQGMITIDNVDDAEEMKATDIAFDVLNFTQVSLPLRIRLLVRFNVYETSRLVSEKIVAREARLVQVYCCYYALW